MKGIFGTRRTDLVGELAEAMANEFNNTMMAVTGYAEMELKKAGTKDRQGLQRLLSQATLATMMIQKLLDFGREHASSLEPQNLDAIIADAVPLLKKLLGEHGELAVALGAGSAFTLIDRIDLEQLLFALIVIVRCADSRDKKVQISTAVVDPGGNSAGKQHHFKPGSYVALSLEARGLTPQGDAVPHEEDWKKNLNSLATDLRRTLKSIGGRVRLELHDSELRITLYFTVAETHPDQKRHSPHQANRTVPQTILVVEDDDAVRIPAAEFLMMEGYKVLQARTGNEALNVVQQSRSTLDVMVTDILMPKMNGCELAAALLSEYPHLKVLYMSGDPDKSSTDAARVGSTTVVLRKPFRLNVLKDRIGELLND